MALFSGKMMASGQGGNFYTLIEAKRANLNDASYRKPSGMFDVATSSSGEVYTLNGERNPLTGLYNSVIAKIGAIGGISWQYTISSAKNCYPCALGCNTSDNSVYICVMETTDLSGANNYNGKRADDTDSSWQDGTNDAIYHFIKFNSSGTRQWENVYKSSNATSYPAAINKVTEGSASHSYSNVFFNRSQESQSTNRQPYIGAPDLQLSKVVGRPGLQSGNSYFHWNNDSSTNERSDGDTYATLGVDTTQQRQCDVYSLDGPHFGGRPQSTSNILIDETNLCFYCLVAANASTTDMSLSRSTMHILKIPFTGVSINAREIVYPGGWDQNAKISFDSSGHLVIPWTSTTKERRYHDQAGSVSTASGNSDYYFYTDTGHSNNISTENLGAYIRYDFSQTTDFEFIRYGQSTEVVVPKVCKVEKEWGAGSTYEYVTTAGLAPAITVEMLGGTQQRDNQNYWSYTARYHNFVGLQKAIKSTGAFEWVRNFFAIPDGAKRDRNNDSQTAGGSGQEMDTRGLPQISVADSKVFVNGIYYVGNVVFQTEGLPNSSPYRNKNSYIGFIAKVNFDGSIDYIREIRSLVDNITEYTNNNAAQFPPYYYQAEQNGGVLLDSINFDAFNNMIVTARHVSDSNVGSSGHFVDNVIFKLPHNGDLIGPIEVRDLFPPVGTTDLRLRRFSYTPASVVRCWEEMLYDANVVDSNGTEKWKLLRCCTGWNTDYNQTVNPTVLGTQQKTATYQATTIPGNPKRLETLDSGTYNGRFLWVAPTQNLQLDTTSTRAWDRAERRGSQGIFLQTFEESDSLSLIEPKASCPAHLYVDQTVSTDNSQTDFDVPTYTKLQGDGSLEESRIKKQEHPNGMITVSQYYDGSTIRKQLLSRHTPTGGVETRMYDTGYNTYPKDVVIDEVGNIYTVGWTADTTGGNNYGVGYITCYDKDLTFQWDYHFTNSDTSTLGDATANFQIHCVAVTMDSTNTAKLFVGGHFTSLSTTVPTQHAIISCIPLTVAGSGAPTIVAAQNSSTSVKVGAGVSNNAIDGVFGLDVFQSDSNDNSTLYVGYAGSLYDTTGATTRGMYGIIEYNGSTPDPTTGSNSSGYVLGDDLKLNTFRFQKGVDSIHNTQQSPWGYSFAVGGQETQSSKTNGVVLICNTQQTINGTTSWASGYEDHPYSVTSFVINNSQGADIVRDMRWGFVEQPSVDTTIAENQDDVHTATQLRYRQLQCWNDRLFVLAAITNQFSQIDTYIIEVTSANLTTRSDGGNGNIQNKTPDAANITRIGKISTSGITDPAGLVINGPEHSTIMTSSSSANSGTPNDRQCLTTKIPLDMSKQDASYREVGSQFVYWSKSDASMSMTARGLFNVEFSVSTSSNYRDGTRFYWGSIGAVAELAAFTSSTAVADISGLGTFSVVTKDLQAYKQS